MKKTIYTILIVVLVVALGAGVYFDSRFQPAQKITWGLDFSQTRAQELGFDPMVVYADMLADLQPQKVRLAAYWEEIEPSPGTYDFTLMDRFLDLAAQNHVQVILAVGKKLPRWPECHVPDWAKGLSPQDQNAQIMDMLTQAVEHFKDSPAITTWQVENEPLFPFGDDCPRVDQSQLASEIALVKSLDSRPVLVTDSGELGSWIPAASQGADLFGTTMYRVVHNPKLGFFKYPLPPLFYRIKAGILETFAPPKGGPIIGVELQAEPWFDNGIENMPLDEQKAMMNPTVLADNLAYAKRAGFGDNYLWGVEWWYWMAEKQGDWGMWTAVKNLLAQNN